MLHGATLLNYAFDTGAGSGSQTITVNLDPFDLSRVLWLDIVLSLTTLDTDAGDTLDVFLEETLDGSTWDQRWHSHQFTGDMSPTEVRRYRISAQNTLDSSDEAYETTGSAGGSNLPAGSVRNGPLAPRLPGTSAPFRSRTTHRVRLVVVDTGSDARFAGTLRIASNGKV